jgi:hypothetical protein
MATGGSLIGALRVTLGLDTANFEAGTKRARSIAQRDASAIQKSLAGIKGSFDGLIAGATIGAFTAAAKRALDYAGSLGEVSQQLGVTTKDLQVYRFIATQVGVEQDTMDASLARLTRTMGEASIGGKSQATAFRELGVAVQDSNGKLYTAGEILPRLADAFAKIKDPATRARLEADLFGKAGQKLDPLLTQGAQGIEALRVEAERLGLVLGDDLINSADNLSDRLASLQKQLEVQFARTIAENADGIMKLADSFVWAAQKALEFFSTMKGVERIKRDEGFLNGFFATWQEQKEASTPAGYAERRKRVLSGAQDRLNSAKQSGSPKVMIDALQREADKQAQLYFQATMAVSAANASAPGSAKPAKQGALPTVKSSGAAKKPPKDRSQQYLERFNKELAGLDDDQLRLQQEIITDVNQRAAIEHQRIQTAQDAYEFDVDSRQKQGELTAAQAQALKTAYEANATREHTLVNWKLDDQLTEQELDRTRARLDNANTLLQGELASARTQEDRRRIQLEILKNETDLQRASLEAVKAKHDSNDIEYKIAQEKLDQLDKESSQQAGTIRRQTMGPLESYLDSIPKTAKEINEAFQAASVEGIGSFKDGLADAILNGGKLGDVLDNALKRFQARLLDLALDKAFQAILGQGSGGSGGDFLSKLGSIFGGGTATGGVGGGIGGGMGSSGGMDLRGLASGGMFRAGGVSGTDQNVLSINGIPKVRVSANENISVHPVGSAGNSGAARIEIVEAPGFASRVVGIAGDVSIRTVGAAGRTSARRATRRLA